MNWSVLRVLYLHELRMLLRTKRMIVLSILLPAIVMPAMLLAARYSRVDRERSLNTTTYFYAVTGPLREKAQLLIADALSALAESTADNLGDLRQFSIQEVRTSDAAAMLEDQTLHFYIDALENESVETPDFSGPSSASVDVKQLQNLPVMKVVYRGNNDASQNGAALMQRLLRYARQVDSERMLRNQGFPVDSEEVFKLKSISNATAAQVSGGRIGRLLTVILVMLLFTGGSVAAIDIIAGEKERGTLETLLTTAAGRNEIVMAKQLAISSVGTAITLIQALNFFVYVRFKFIPLPPDFAIQISTVDFFALLLLFLPLAAAISATLLAISAYAKTYKEAQMYFFPIYLVGIIPALAAVLPGISLRSIIVLVPVANVSVAVREILTGRPDPLMILLAVAVMSMTAMGLMRKSATMLSQEDMISSGHSDSSDIIGGPQLFQKRVLRWFAVMWAIIFAVAASIPEFATFRGQILFNELIIFLGASLLMIKVYNLNIKETLAIRPVKPAIWLAVLIAIPCGSIATHAVFRILNVFVPVSQRLTESFGQSLFPEGMPQWQIYLYAAAIPALCEEIAFRGLLLHGVRKRFRIVLLPVIAGAIFGMFHFTLFRIAPTAFLGIVMTTIALLTGSIFPGMLLHFGNNAFGLWTASNNVSLETLEWWHYAAPVALFIFAFYVIYRNRTPYPDAGRSLPGSTQGLPLVATSVVHEEGHR